jgi:hypothetical protein
MDTLNSLRMLYKSVAKGIVKERDHMKNSRMDRTIILNILNIGVCGWFL